MNACLLFAQKIAKSPNSLFSSLFLFLVLLFLPTQLGYHFWPEFAYVNGLRIDYLSPVIYITDICVAILFVLHIRGFVVSLKLGYVLLGLILVVGIFLSSSPFAGWYGLIKLIEFIFLGWFVALNTQQTIKYLQIVFPVGLVTESILAIWQFVLQHSVGGLWYFLGERTFSGSTPGIANASLNGSLVLRPYATFPHPNVLAGYLLIGLLFLCLFFRQQTKIRKVVYGSAMTLGVLALLITLSRTAILVGTFLIIFLIVFHVDKQSVQRKLQIGLVSVCVFGLLALVLLPRFVGVNVSGESVTLREELFFAAWHMSLAHPIFGVGLNNFLTSLSVIAPQLPIQPVHNIFMLILAQAGVVGSGVFVFLLYKSVRHILRLSFEHRLMENTRIFVFFSFIIFLFVGLFDHYFLTLQQGQLLTALIFGLAWTSHEN